MEPQSPSDVELLAKLLWGENSISLKEEEALRIGDSVLNRVVLPHYPQTIRDVILQKKQYSPFNPTDPNFRRVQEFGPDHPRWPEYEQYAARVLDPMRPRTNVTHYFANEVPPSWAESMSGLVKKGAHWFGQEDPRSRRRPLAQAAMKAFGKRK